MATVYSITSMKGNKVYIGSTVSNITQRKASHIHRSHNCTSNILFDEYGSENCIFTVLEECTLEQRFERERFYIENTPDAVNKYIPSRTKKEYGLEWRKNNKQQCNNKSLEWYNKNKEEYNRKRREDRKAKKESNSI